MSEQCKENVYKIAFDEVTRICDLVSDYVLNNELAAKDKIFFSSEGLRILVAKQCYSDIMEPVSRYFYLTECNNDVKTKILCKSSTIAALLNKIIEKRFYYRINIKDVILNLMILPINILVNIRKFFIKGNWKVLVEVSQTVALGGSIFRDDINWWSEKVCGRKDICLFSRGHNVKGSESFCHIRQSFFLRVRRHFATIFYRKTNDPILDWHKEFIPYCYNLYSWWRSFLSTTGVRVIVCGNEMLLDSVIQRIVLERLGGVTVFRQRSEYYSSDAYLLMPGHLLLCWSNFFEKNKVSQRLGFEKAIPVGHIYDIAPAFNGKYKNSSLENISDGFNLLLVDNSVGPFVGGLGILYENEVEVLMHHLRDFLMEHKKTNLIIKLKRANSILKDIVKNDNSLRNLQHAGRVVFVYEENLLTASLYSYVSLCIGMPISSATLELAIIGKKCLIYSPRNFGSHFLEKEYQDQLYFNDVNSLMGAVDNCYHGIGNQGDFSVCIDRFDSFRDGLSSQRVGRIVKFLLTTDLKNKAALYKDIENIA